MRLRHFAFIMAFISLTSGCYAELTGTVVDAETGQPIEGAVIFVEWTTTKGLPGFSYQKSYKVIEAISDREGMVSISGVFNPSVNPPNVTVYKRGYVAWNNKFIFPDYSKRKDSKWRDGYVFKLEHFNPEYTHDAHTSFIDMAIWAGQSMEEKGNMKRAIRWEEIKAFEERLKKGKNKTN